MRGVSSPTLTNSVVALVVLSAIAVIAAIGQARAEDCLAAPNASSPPGQHWYYRIDRVKQRKCWYLHSPLSIAHQAHRKSVPVEEANIDQPAPAAPAPVMTTSMTPVAAPIPFAAVPMPAAAAPIPAAAAPVPAPDPPVAAPPATDDTASLPHVPVLAVKTIAVRRPGAEAETQSRHGVGEPSIQDASMHTYSAIAERKSEPTTFFALVFGLGVATFLIAIVIKYATSQASWPWRRIRVAADMDWQQERPDYSDAGPVRFRSPTQLARNDCPEDENLAPLADPNLNALRRRVREIFETREEVA